MKKKDINTVIRERIAKGEGISYKDEYWNKMDDLLNMSLPVTQAEPIASNVARVSKALQISTILSIVTATAVVLYYTLLPNLNTPKQPAIEQPQIQTSLEAHQEENSHHTHAAVSNPASNAPTSNPSSEVTVSNQTLDASVSNPSSEVTSSPQNERQTTKTISTEQATSNTSTKNDNSKFSNQNIPPIEIQDEGADFAMAKEQNNFIKNAETEDALVVKNTGFHLILPKENNAIHLETSNPEYAKPLWLKYPNRNRFIQHASFSPFVGLNIKNESQTYTSGKITYTNPKQTQLVYGLNLQLETKHFALRTGLGISTASLNYSAQSIENQYGFDTTYIIVNANYQTTPSGKPIALIRQQIDSSISSSQTHLQEGVTEYNYLIVPLTLQYNIAHKKISFVLEGGVLHNFILSSKSNGEFETESSKAEISLPQYKLQLTAGAGIGYALNSKYTLGTHYNYAWSRPSNSVSLLNNSHIITLTITRSLW